MTTFRSRWIMPAMLLFGCGVDLGGGDPCVASSSAVERDACHAALAASADSALERYFALAMEQAAAPAELQAAQVAWEGYVDLHCHAIYENYAEAPIRSSLFTMCRWELARARTAELWRGYLDKSEVDVPPPAGAE